MHATEVAHGDGDDDMLRCAIRWKCNKKRSRFGGLGPSRRPLCRGRTWEIALSPRVIVDKSYHLCERQIKKKLSLEERGDRGENHRKGARRPHDARVLYYLGGAAHPRSVGGAAMIYVSLRVQLCPARGAGAL